MLALLCVACSLGLPSLSRARAEESTAGFPTEVSEGPFAACGTPGPGRARCLAVVDPKSDGLGPEAEGFPSEGAEPAGGSAPAGCFVSETESCGSGVDHGLSPQDLMSAYRLPSMTAGYGQTVAIVDAYDDPNAQEDLNVYRSTYGLPPCEAGCFTKVDQEGGTDYPPPNPSWALEISLDLDMVSAACPNCHILLVEANDNSLENLAIAEDQAVALGATEISNSYSAREIEVGKVKVEELAAHYHHPGVPITVASGDDGYNNEEFEIEDKYGNCTNCSPSFPASLNTVISVGGTELAQSGTEGRGWRESTWFYSGSGCSLYSAKPAWQTDEGCAGRTDNDVAAAASATTPVSVYDTYGLANPGWQNVGGTSVSAPLTAAAIALQSKTVRAEGVEGIYKSTSAWYDVTEGSNYSVQGKCKPEYLCVGQAGYDGPTGVGTPNGGATATPPGAITEAASGVTPTTATINGIVNPERSAEATYFFQWGPSTGYGEKVPIHGAAIPGYTKPARVSRPLTGLKPATLYHYRVVAESPGGTTYGADRTFSTAPKIFSRKFGSQGSAAGELAAPEWTATDLHGNVWVADTGNDRIEEYTADGSFIRACGGSGSGNGEFDGPTGIAVNTVPGGARGGYVYVSDTGNDRIEVLTPECEFVEAIGTPGSGEGELSEPMGLTFGRGGFRVYKQPFVLLVADTGNNRVEAFNWAGNNAQWDPGEFVAAFGSKGYGNGQFDHPTDVILVGHEKYGTEDFFVVDSGNHRIVRIQEREYVTQEPISFKYLSKFGSWGSGPGQLSAPTGIAFDHSTGTFAVTDTGNDRVEEFLPDGTHVASLGAGGGAEGFDSPRGISADAAGNLIVADAERDRIEVWRSSRTSAGAEWRVALPAGPPGAEIGDLNSVSCISATSICIAVGRYSWTGGHYRPTAQRWEDGQWSRDVMPNPSGAETAQVERVACVSASLCRAVGYYETSTAVVPLVETWDGNEWTIQSVPLPGGASDGILRGISCTAVTACTAVGAYESEPGVVATLVERFDGSEWKVQASPNPDPENSRASSVSCVSATDCRMVGYYESGPSERFAFAERWDGSEWSTEAMPSPPGFTTDVAEVACPTASACAAVGWYRNAAGNEVAFAELWDGSEWALREVATPDQAKNFRFKDLACSSTVDCIAVGGTWTTEGGYRPLVERWNGNAWWIQSAANDPEERGTLRGVSCGSPSFCVAVGESDAVPFAEVYEGSLRFRAAFGGQSSGPGRLSRPDGIAIDPGGNLWVADTAHARIQEFDPQGQFVRQFGGYGRGIADLRAPTDLALDSQGNVWVTDSLDHRVVEFDAKGNLIRQFGGYGAGAGQLKSPAGIAIGSEDEVWVVDTGNHRLQKFDPQGQYAGEIDSIAGAGVSARGIAIGPGGEIWITDGYGGTVAELGPEGELVRQFGEPGSGNGEFRNPEGIAIGPKGNVWVADTENSRIQTFSETGAYLGQFGTEGRGEGQFFRPKGVALDAEGGVWVADTSNNRVQKISAGEFAGQFGGPGPGHLEAPGDAVTGPEGNVYVADSAHNRIEVFDSEGEFVRQFGGSGSGPGQFWTPQGIALGPEGDLFVADTNRHRIQELTLGGQFVRQFGGFGQGNGWLRAPSGVAVDSTGNVWVADTNNDRVQEFGPGGEFLAKFGSFGSGNGQFAHPSAIAVDAEDNVWVADTNNNRVQELDPEGNFVLAFGSAGEGEGQLSLPRGIAIGPEGNVWVADTENSRIQTFSETGTYLGQLGTAGSNGGEFFKPRGLEIDPAGDLWVADTGNDRVQEVHAGEFSRQFGNEDDEAGHLAAPQGVATDSEGNVWVADSGHSRIQEFDGEGAFIRQFGSPGSRDGQFSGPAGVAVGPDDEVWVVDTWNSRLQEFDREGDLIRTVGSEGSGAGELASPEAIAVGPAGEVWVADTENGRVEEFDSEGQFVRQFGEEAGLVFPMGIAVGPKGNVWVADPYAGPVAEFTPTGELVRKFEHPVSGPWHASVGVAVGPNGEVWISDYYGNRIEAFSSSGEYLGGLGSSGNNEGQLYGPRGLAVGPEGELWVADSGNDRVEGWGR